MAEYGDIHAKYFLGLLYRDGGLLIPDAEKVRHWLEQAAKQNLPDAQYPLGHRPDDHEDPEMDRVSMGGMTMKGW